MLFAEITQPIVPVDPVALLSDSGKSCRALQQETASRQMNDGRQ